LILHRAYNTFHFSDISNARFARGARGCSTQLSPTPLCIFPLVSLLTLIMFSRNPPNINTGLYPPRQNPALYDSQATLSPAHNNASDLELNSYPSSPNAVSPSGTRTMRDVGGMRTPSPTPSEERELATAGAFDWKRLKNWRFWIRREWTCSFFGFFFISSFVDAMFVRVLSTGSYHHHRCCSGYHFPYSDSHLFEARCKLDA
jgi:hypothetical protein